MTPLSQKEFMPSKHQHIIPMPLPTMTTRSSSPSSHLPIIVVPKLAIPSHTHPEQINHPSGYKDYQCQLCAFQHINRDCMPMHIHQHLEISIGCPMCGKGFQNATCLQKHGKKVHAIWIVEAENE